MFGADAVKTLASTKAAENPQDEEVQVPVEL
jgi:hypothetical protein